MKDEKRARSDVASGVAIAEGITLARRLAMMPGNMCTPDYLADIARDIAKRHGMKSTVMGRKEMEEEGMGSFLGVAQGTPQDPKLIALEHRRWIGPPRRSGGQGTLLRFGGYLDQAGTEHGAHEVRHVRRGRGPRRDGGDWAAGPEDQRGRARREHDEHAGRKCV